MKGCKMRGPSETVGASTESRRGNRIGIFLIVVSTIAWSSGGLFVRLLPYDAWTIILWRGVFASIFIGSFVLFKLGPGMVGAIRNLGAVGALATVLSTATITQFIFAFQHTTVANAMTIYAALPFLTAGISYLWLRERPSVPTLFASGIALVGIVIMFGPASMGLRIGDLLAFSATSTTALLTIIIRRNSHIEMLPVAFLSAALSTIIAVPFAGHPFDLTAQEYLVAAGFGLVPMTLGMMLYVIGSALIPATLSALIGTMEAPIGALWAWIGVGEVPAATTLIGGAIVMAGVFGRVLYEFREERTRMRLAET